MNNWLDLYRQLKAKYGYEPEPLLIEYINLIEKGKVLDLGVGTGRNSLFLSEIGYDVEAVDMSEDSINKYIDKANKLQIKVSTTVEDIRNFEIKEGEYSLIIISWVLNFFKKSDVDAIIEKIKKGLKPNGVVYMSVFSIYDDFYTKNIDKACDEENSLCFNESNYRHYYTKEEVLTYFEDLEVIAFKAGTFLDEEEDIGKHYHDGFEYLGRKNI